MEFRNLDYFLAVAEHGSLRAAAQRLGVTQPALTKAVRRIEDSFGVALFDRHARGLSLNAYGAAFLAHAQDLSTSLQAASQEIAALRRGVSGVVNIGAGSFWQDAVLPEAIAEMRSVRPDVLISVMGGGDDHLRELLKTGRLAFILAAVPQGTRSEPGLEWENLLVDEYRVIADVHHPLHSKQGTTIRDLLDYPWILPARGTYMVGRLGLLLRSHGMPEPLPAVETESISLKFKLMRDSHYLSFHAMAHLKVYRPEHIAPVAIPGASATRNAGFLKRQGASLRPADEALIAILRRMCDELGLSAGNGGGRHGRPKPEAKRPVKPPAKPIGRRWSAEG